ncbi:MAG: glutathione S-transferase family protein [Burkholderiales bacterium]|nr:MAG: glutathione S-transferase family protein [Betaproteobacteria bacterium]TAG24436.1 MAG: glutathione S-transferase family protein [Burkholderiales bacterium]
MITLHYFPSNASITPHILLEELGVPFKLELVDRASGAHKTPQYLALNPNGLIPVLIDGDLVLYETAAIALHLVDTHPTCGLAPPLGTAQRAHFYKWLMWMTNTLQAALIMYFYPERYVPDGDVAAADALRMLTQRKIGGYLRQLDDQFAAHGKPWLVGDAYSAADVYAFMLCRWTRGFSGDAAKPARDHAHVGPFLQRMLQRPAVQRVIATERLSPPLV